MMAKTPDQYTDNVNHRSRPSQPHQLPPNLQQQRVRNSGSGLDANLTNYRSRLPPSQTNFYDLNLLNIGSSSSSASQSSIHSAHRATNGQLHQHQQELYRNYGPSNGSSPAFPQQNMSHAWNPAQSNYQSNGHLPPPIDPSKSPIIQNSNHNELLSNNDIRNYLFQNGKQHQRPQPQQQQQMYNSPASSSKAPTANATSHGTNAFPLLSHHVDKRRTHPNTTLQRESTSSSFVSAKVDRNKSQPPPLPVPKVQSSFRSNEVQKNTSNQNIVIKKSLQQEENVMDMSSLASSLSIENSKTNSSVFKLPEVHYHSFTDGHPCQDKDCISKITTKYDMLKYRHQFPHVPFPSNGIGPSLGEVCSKDKKLTSKILASCTYVRLKKLNVDWESPPPKACCDASWVSRLTWDPEFHDNLLNREEEDETSEEEETPLKINIQLLKRRFGGEHLPVKVEPSETQEITFKPEPMDTSQIPLNNNDEHAEEDIPEHGQVLFNETSLHKPVTKLPQKTPAKGSKSRPARFCFFEEYFFAEYKEKGIQPAITSAKVDCPLCGLRLCCQHFANHMVISHLCHELIDSEDLLCLHCFRKFETEEALHDHYNMVNNVTPLSCMICLLQFNNESDRMHHMRTKHYRFTMPYQCQLCKYRSSLQLQFANHFDRVHTEAYCPCCLKVFPSSFGLHHVTNRSLQSHAAATMKFFMEVRLHMTRHMAAKDLYACDQCSLTFINADDLGVHKKVAHVCYLKQPRLKSNKTMVLDKFQLTQQQQTNLTFFRNEAELIAAIGPTVTFDQPTSSFGFPKKSNKRGLKNFGEIGDDESQDSTCNSSPQGNGGDDLFGEESASNEDVVMKEVDNKAKPSLLFMGDVLDNMFISKDDRHVEHQAAPLHCDECLKVVYTNSSEKDKALLYHYLPITFECHEGNCCFRTNCKEAKRAHDHAFVFSEQRKVPHPILDPAKVSNNHKSHISLCRNCGMRFLSVEEFCMHIHNFQHHRGYSDYANENEDSSDEEGAPPKEEVVILPARRRAQRDTQQRQPLRINQQASRLASQNEFNEENSLYAPGPSNRRD